MNRRTFIESSLASVAVASLPFRGLAAAHQVDPIGMQLYTVRDLMKTDVPGTLAKVGRHRLQGGRVRRLLRQVAEATFGALLDKNGLAAPSCHVSYSVVQNKWPETIESRQDSPATNTSSAPGFDDSQRQSLDGYKRAAELFNKAGEASRKAGIQFGYHNHFWEFLPDKAPRRQVALRFPA